MLPVYYYYCSSGEKDKLSLTGIFRKDKRKIYNAIIGVFYSCDLEIKIQRHS